MSKYSVYKECNLINKERNVRSGQVYHDVVFENIKGNFLMSGCFASDEQLLCDLIYNFQERNDMPTLVLTSHRAVMENMKSVPGVYVSGSGSKNYHPMYGMNKQQICKLVQMAAEEVGSHTYFSRLFPFLMAALDIVSSRYPVSLPALIGLLERDDEYIAQFALQQGMSEQIANSIRGNREGGILLRRILEHLLQTFEEVATKDSETKHNTISCAERGNLVIVLYQCSPNQKIFNSYLREELYSVLQRTSKVRIVADEICFTSEEDELLLFLLQMKRQGRIELIACSECIQEMFQGHRLDFENICIFSHRTVPKTEELSESVFGKYVYHYVNISVGRPPALLFTLRKDKRWSSQQEERLRVRAVDLQERHRELLAIKLWNYKDVYLVPVNIFLQREPYREDLRKEKLEKAFDRLFGHLDSSQDWDDGWNFDDEDD